MRCEVLRARHDREPAPAGERIAIAANCWIVEEVDWKRHLVYCTQVKGRVPRTSATARAISTRHVLDRMRRVLTESCGYPTSWRTQRARLAQARHVAANAHLTDRPLINLEATPGRCCRGWAATPSSPSSGCSRSGAPASWA